MTRSKAMNKAREWSELVTFVTYAVERKDGVWEVLSEYSPGYVDLLQSFTYRGGEQIK